MNILSVHPHIRISIHPFTSTEGREKKGTRQYKEAPPNMFRHYASSDRTRMPSVSLSRARSLRSHRTSAGVPLSCPSHGTPCRRHVPSPVVRSKVPVRPPDWTDTQKRQRRKKRKPTRNSPAAPPAGPPPSLPDFYVQ